MHRGLWPEAALALICAAAFLAALLFPLAALATPYTPEERTLLDAYASGQINLSEFARICGLSRPTVYKYLKLIWG